MLLVKDLEFGYFASKLVLKNINFELKENGFYSILGESGSGKSTLLKLIYGLENLTKGAILFNGELVTGPKFNLVPGHPDMKFVPQEFDLLDYVTVGENVGKYISNFDLPAKAQTISQALKAVQLSEFENVKPTTLSGGQRQRVSLARALAAQPKVLLLDEPYGQLDQPLKHKLRESIALWARNHHCTVVLTTHDVEDALGFSNEIIVLKEGMITQQAPPVLLRQQPANEYVVSLLGEYNKISAIDFQRLFGIKLPMNKSAILYPEELKEDENGTEFQIQSSRFLGRDYLVTVINGDTTLRFFSTRLPKRPEIKLIHVNYRSV